MEIQLRKSLIQAFIYKAEHLSGLQRGLWEKGSGE